MCQLGLHQNAVTLHAWQAHFDVAALSTAVLAWESMAAGPLAGSRYMCGHGRVVLICGRSGVSGVTYTTYSGVAQKGLGRFEGSPTGGCFLGDFEVSGEPCMVL